MNQDRDRALEDALSHVNPARREFLRAFFIGMAVLAAAPAMTIEAEAKGKGGGGHGRGGKKKKGGGRGHKGK